MRKEAKQALHDLVRDQLENIVNAGVHLNYVDKETGEFSAYSGRKTIEGKCDPLTAEVDWDQTSIWV